MKDSTPSKEESTPMKPTCPFCQGEVIFPEFKEGCHPEPPKCSKCGKYIPPPGEFHPFVAGFGFDFYNDPHNFGPRHHRRRMSPPKCKNCDTVYPPLEFKSGEPIKMPKCSFCETEMEPPAYLPRCKNCDTLYPFPIYKPGEPPIMPKCSFCQTEMDPPRGPKCQKCGAPIPRLTREEREQRRQLYMLGKNPEPRKCAQCGEELKRPNLPFFGHHHGPHGPHGPHWPHGLHGPHGPHGMWPHGPHFHHHGPHGWGFWRFGWGNWMNNQGFMPKSDGKNEKTDNGEKMKQEENVYDYYGYNYFSPWMRRFGPQNQEKPQEKPEEKPENNNKISNEGAPSYPNMNNPYGNNDYSQWGQYGPWNYGYGGGFGFGWPPYGHGGFGYGNGQPPYPNNPPPQEQPPQEQPPENFNNEGNFEDMPFYDPYFGYNYQFGQNQGENNNNTKKP